MAESKLPYEKQFADLKTLIAEFTQTMAQLNVVTDEYIKKGQIIQKQKPTTLKETNETTKRLHENTQKLTTLEKEREKVKEQQTKTLTKILVNREKYNKFLQKGKFI